MKCQCVCAQRVYLAVALAAGLVAVGIKAFAGVTVAGTAGRTPPPSPWTLLLNPVTYTHTHTHTPHAQIHTHTHTHTTCTDTPTHTHTEQTVSGATPD